MIEAFRRSRQRNRKLVVLPTRGLDADLAGLELRLTPDLLATERQTQKHIFFNFRRAPIPPNVARATLELAHWVLSQNGVSVAVHDIEFVDLAARKVHTISRIRPKTMSRARRNAQIVIQLWGTI